MDDKMLLEAIRSIVREETAPIKEDIGTLKADVGTLKSDVGTLKADVGTLKADVGTLKADVGTLKTDVGTLKSDVGTLKADVGELKHRVLKIELTLENEIRPNIQIVAEGQVGIVERLDRVERKVDDIDDSVAVLRLITLKS